MPQYPKIGVQYDFRLSTREDDQRTWSEFADATLTACRELDAAGVDGLWLTEHHFVGDGYLPALLPMAAALAVTTTRCDIGTSVLLAPLHHPLALAEAAAVVDNLSHGRFVLGLGLGYRGQELAAFGVRKQERARRMEETLEILTQSWSAGPLEFAGEFFTVPPVDVVPKPVQQPPRLWLAARARPTALRAGRWGSGIILGSDADPQLRRTYLDAAHEAGRETSSLDVAQLRSTLILDLIGRNHLTEINAGLARRSSDYGEWFADAGDLPEDRVERRPSPGAGVPERSLAEELEQLAELAAAGTTYVIYPGTAPGVDPAVYVPQWTALVDATR